MVHSIQHGMSVRQCHSCPPAWRIMCWPCCLVLTAVLVCTRGRRADRTDSPLFHQVRGSLLHSGMPAVPDDHLFPRYYSLYGSYFILVCFCTAQFPTRILPAGRTAVPPAFAPTLYPYYYPTTTTTGLLYSGTARAILFFLVSLGRTGR